MRIEMGNYFHIFEHKKIFVTFSLLLSIFVTSSLSQTINNSGICTIITQGNNNSGIYIQYCDPSGVAKLELLDPPLLWLGMDIPALKSFVGSRSPIERTENGITVITARGTLFGLSGTSQYGFDHDGKLAWMSVENQCTEMKYDYVLKTQPADIDPSWLQWHNSLDYRQSYETTTECSRILDVPKTLRKLFGSPMDEQSTSHVGRLPSATEICNGLDSQPDYCTDTGASRSTFFDEFIGPDSLTGIGFVSRELIMHADVQQGDYLPRAMRREIVGVASVWGPKGRPESNPRAYGNFRAYLGRELP
jgi:hypothetical protein